MDKVYTLITGSTGGLGKAFVDVICEKNENIILTGRSNEKLESLKEDIIKKYPKLDVIFYSADLTDVNSRNEMFKNIKDRNIKINRLINVAGVDIQKGLAEYTQEKISFQCRVNFEAAVSLCRFVLDVKSDYLEIINISSVSGIYPMPYFAIYSATKSALTYLSLALREELKDKNVHVTAVLPGAMPTRDDIKEQIKGQGLWGKLAAKSPRFVALKSLKSVRKNKKKCIPGFWNNFMNIFTKLCPLSLKLKFIGKRWSKISKDAF